MQAPDSRRSFLGKLLAGGLLAGLSGAIGAVIGYLFPHEEAVSALGPRRFRIGRAEEIAPGAGKLALVDDQPVWIVHTAAGFVGLSARCTHKGCIVSWEQPRGLFLCPCHEGSFDERGNVISGLPLRALSRFRVAITDGDIYVSRAEGCAG